MGRRLILSHAHPREGSYHPGTPELGTAPKPGPRPQSQGHGLSAIMPGFVQGWCGVFAIPEAPPGLRHHLSTRATAAGAEHPLSTSVCVLGIFLILEGAAGREKQGTSLCWMRHQESARRAGMGAAVPGSASSMPKSGRERPLVASEEPEPLVRYLARKMKHFPGAAWGK